MRICFYGGPGCGKSNRAHEVCTILGKQGLAIDYVPEFVKSWAYQKRIPKSFDQVYLFARQLHDEDQLLQVCPHIVTDSPPLMAVAYTNRDNPSFSPHILGLALEFEKRWPTLNIFLDRSNLEYKTLGRYEDLDGAIRVDSEIKNLLVSNKISYKSLDTTNISEIITYINSYIS